MVNSEIWFRADGGRQVGGGHLARCRAVAEVLAEQGSSLTLVCTRETSQQAGSFLEAPWRIVLVDHAGDFPEDAKCAALLVDHYGLGAEWESDRIAEGCRVVALDDLVRAHAPGASVVRPGDPPSGRLTGPGWLPLRPRLQGLRAARQDRVGTIGRLRVVIMPGLVDLHDLGSHALLALDQVARANGIALDVHLIVGAVARHLQPLRQAADRFRAAVHLDLPDPLPLLASADIGLGTAGVAAWERAALGLPSLAVAVVHNQLPGAALLESSGGAAWVGRRGSTLPDLREPLERLLSDPAARAIASAQALTACDGRGAWRVAELLAPIP